MESKLLSEVKTDTIKLDLAERLEKVLKPILQSTEELGESVGKKYSDFIVKFLRECHDVFDQTTSKSIVIKASLIACKGLSQLKYGYSKDQLTMGKLIHFIMIKLLKIPVFVPLAEEMCRFLFELVLQMDREGNLPDTKHNSPLAANSFIYLWNASIKRQKAGSKGDLEFSLLSYALRFHGMVAEPNSVFDNYLTNVRKEVRFCEDSDVVDRILKLSVDLLEFLVVKFKKTAPNVSRVGISQLATIASCIAINNRRTEKVDEILKVVENVTDESFCLKLLNSWRDSELKSVTLLITEMETKANDEYECFCRTEILYSLMNEDEERVEYFETLFLKSAKEEYSFLKYYATDEKELAKQRRSRYTSVAANITTVSMTRLSRQTPDYETEVNSYEAFLLDYIDFTQSSFFIKKLHELAYIVLKFAQNLKSSNLQAAIKYFEKALDMLEIWLRISRRSKTELWSVYHELSWMYMNDKKGEKALSLLESVAVENQKNISEIAAMYVKCKKTFSILNQKRYLTAKISASDSDFTLVLKSEFQALKKCKVDLVKDALNDILDKLFSVENETAEHGYILLEKSILLWATSEFDSGLEILNEAVITLEGNDSSLSKEPGHLARAYLWKYVMEKSKLQGEYKIIRKEQEINYKNEVNDFNENHDNERSALKFKDSFMLKEEHELDVYLVKSLNFFEKTETEFSADMLSDINLLYGVLFLNGSHEFGRRVARLVQTDAGLLMQAQALYELSQHDQALELLTKCEDQKSVDYILSKSRLLLAVGRVEEGYAILEPLCADCMQLSTRSLGHFTSLMSEYQRLPLQVLNVDVSLEKEHKNPLYLATLALQCLERSFHKASGLEPDPYGDLPEKPNSGNSLASMTSQFLVLSEYLQALVEGSRRYAEVGESKHAKTYLQDGLVLSLRYCLPKWTSRVLIESAKLSLMEGRVVQSREKLQRAHLILNFEFMEMKAEEEAEPEPEVVKMEVVNCAEKNRAENLMARLGFDTGDDDVIKTKCLKTSSSMAKQQARSLADTEPRLLIPANHDDCCKTCGKICRLRNDFSLAYLSLEILVVQSDCFLQGGSKEGVEAVDESVTVLLSDYQARFSNPAAFKDLSCQQNLNMAKSNVDQIPPVCEKLIEDLSLSSQHDMIRCFQILAEAYYLLGSQTLDQHFVKSTPIGQEKEPIKKTLSEQLYSDDENDDFQIQMQDEAKEMKAMNEKPASKNGRRRRKPSAADVSSPDVLEIRPTLPTNDVTMTPQCRITNVSIVRKARGRPRRNLTVNLDDNSPALTAAPRRGRKLERTTLESTSSADLKAKAKVQISSPAESVPISTPGDSPSSVTSEDLNRLLDSMTLNDSSKLTRTKSKTKSRRSKKMDTDKTESGDVKKPGTKTSTRTSKSTTKTPNPEPLTVPESKTKTKTRARKNASSDETPVATVQRKTRGTRTRAAENLRAGSDNEEGRPENENLIGEFREAPDWSFPSPAARDWDYGEPFPMIETLRGPPQSARGRRKVLNEMSPGNNLGTGDAPKSVKASRKERIIKTEVVVFTTDDSSRNYLEESFRLLRHHPVTSLYRNVCSALGLMTSQSDVWLSAYYLNEAACVAYRHEALMAIQKKRTSRKHSKLVNETEEMDSKVEEFVSFPRDVQHFRTMIQSLPCDWTIVQISIMTSLESANHMIVTRLRANQRPLILQCPGYATHAEQLIEAFEETIVDSRMRNNNCEDRVRWWTAKRMYSKNVQETIEKLENDVFDHWKGILLGCYGNSDTVATVTKKSREILSKTKTKHSERDQQLLELVLDSASYLTDTQLRNALGDIFPMDSDQQTKALTQIQAFKNMYPMTGSRDPLILILDKTITNLPIDNMPIISTKPVVRSLSVYSLYCQHVVNAHYQHQRLQLTGPDMTNISYILDPDHNLPQTRDNFADWFDQLGWLGSVGKCPSRQEFEQNLTNTDMMLYLGHGSGQRYFEGTLIQKLHCKAAVVLMGCSSGVLKSDGAMEPRGMVLNYLLARSPFIMGNIWDVTDGDIDRFTKALLEYWLSAEPGTKLYSAMQHARNACRLRHLTGSAPVMYGLPL